MSDDNDNKVENEHVERVYHWWIRYVLVPVALAFVAGLFALAVVDRQVAGDLEVARLEIADSGPGVTAQANEVVDSKRTPTATPDLQPSRATAELIVGTATVSPEENPSPSSETFDIQPRCGQIPPSWERYTVRWGDTLYALARRTNTTVEAIRLANCLPGTLKAFEQIWLPSVIITPTATVTPTPSPTVIQVSPAPTDGAPEAFIIDPGDRSRHAHDGRDGELWYSDLLLQGTATDSEDGDLAGSALVWTTNRTDLQPAVLGTGTNVGVRLYSAACKGALHEITLTATDSAGHVARDVSSVFIEDQC